MPVVVGVRFHAAGKISLFDARDFELFMGDTVVVNTPGGLALGQVALEPYRISCCREELLAVVRKADERDLMVAAQLRQKEQAAFERCQELIRECRSPMQLSYVEYLLSGNKAVFYFTADNRVDFRDLVRTLAKDLHVKVEMRQIGVRDEAKLLGGIGMCGRPLCCATFLSDFNQVSIKMAKDQNLSLNPEKVSGQCGRLLCCIEYEHCNYRNMLKGLPKLGKRCVSPHGEARVLDINIFLKTLQVITLDQGREIRVYDIERYRQWMADEQSMSPDEVLYIPQEKVAPNEAAINGVASFEEEQEKRLGDRMADFRKDDDKDEHDGKGRSRSGRRRNRRPREDRPQEGAPLSEHPQTGPRPDAPEHSRRPERPRDAERPPRPERPAADGAPGPEGNQAAAPGGEHRSGSHRSRHRHRPPRNRDGGDQNKG